jgi:hypothetical protein
MHVVVSSLPPLTCRAALFDVDECVGDALLV